MLLGSILTPQMGHAIASIQEEQEKVAQEAGGAETDKDFADGESLSGDVPTPAEGDSHVDGDNDVEIVAPAVVEGEPADEGFSTTSADEPADNTPEEPTGLDPPTMGILKQITNSLITDFEMVLNPGEIIIDGTEDEVNIKVQDIKTAALNYTLVKPDEIVVNPGDTYIIDLPEIFKQELAAPQSITIDEIEVATYIIENGQAVVTFNAAVEYFDNAEMHVNIQGEFNSEPFEGEGPVLVEVPYSDATSFFVTVRPEQAEYKGEDKKTAGSQYVLNENNEKVTVTRNPEFIDWTVRVNDSMGTFSDARVIDDLHANLKYVEGSIKVERIIRNYQNQELRREEVTVTDEMFEATTSGFELDLGNISDAYEITYTTNIIRPDGGGTHTINNTARIILDDSTKNVQDDFTGSWSGDLPAINKEGVISEGREDIIHWTVEYNYGKEDLGNVTLTDTLSHGEIVADSVQVYSVNPDVDGNVSELGDSTAGSFPLDLDADGKAYYITFSSWAPVGLNDTVINTVSDNLDPIPNKDDASVSVNTIPTGGKVGEQDVDEDGRPYIDWTITMNYEKVDVPSIHILDVFDPVYLEFDVNDSNLFKLLKDDEEADNNFEIEEYTHTDGRTGFELNILNAGPHTYKFVYRTYYTVEGMQQPELANNAEIVFRDGEGTGIGNTIYPDVKQEGPKAGIHKSGAYIRVENNIEQQIEWKVVFNQSKIMLDATKTSIDDIFISNNIEYVDGSIKVVDENNEGFNGYNFVEKTFEVNTGTEEAPVIETRNGFTIQLTEDTNKTLTLSYRTTTDDDKLANDVHKNEAILKWQGGEQKADATVGVRHPGLNKSGNVTINPDGSKTVNWTINFNTNANIIHDFKLIDTYIPTTVTLSDIKIMSGETDVTDQFTISEERTGGTLTLEKARLDAVPYTLTYSTTLSADEEKENLVNTAAITYTGGKDDVTSTINKPTLGVQKEVVGQVDKTENGDFITWKIIANTDAANKLVNLVNAELTDTIPSDQRLVKGTISVDQIYKEEKTRITLETDKLTENDNDFTIKLPNGAYQYEVTFQTEIIKYPSVHPTVLDRYTNKTTLANPGYEDANDDAFVDYFADGTNNDNVKEGKVNNETENIDWTAILNPLGLDIDNAKIKDQLSDNHTYVMEVDEDEKEKFNITVIAGTEELTQGEVPAEGGEPTGDYIVTLAEDKRSFEIAFNQNINEPITVKYSTRVNPDLIGNITVNNKIVLTGGEFDKTFDESEVESTTSQWTFGGGGSGRQLEFTLRKENPSGESVAGATFDFLRYPPAGGTEIPIVGEDITTDSNGQFLLKNVRAGRYKVTEDSAPDGYVSLTEPFYIIVGYGDPNKGQGKYVVQVTDSKWNVLENSDKVIGNDSTAGSGAELIVVNEHKPVTASLEAEKSFTGNIPLSTDQFKFELVEIDVDSNEKVLQTKSNDADGTISFDAISYNTTGTYNYIIREVPNTLTGVTGVTYDETDYPVTVTVTSNSVGTLTANVNYGANITVPKFENTYEAEPVTVTLNAKKALTGQAFSEENKFSFDLIDSESNIVDTVQNDLNGNISFNELSFTEIGTYSYTVEEKDSGQGGMTYDSSVYEVVIIVTDDHKGQLVANTEISKVGSTDEITEIQFANSYQAQPTTAVVKATKELSGQPLEAEQFEFLLKGTNNTTEITAKNNAKKEVVFAELEFNKAGTYTYTLSEVEGNQGGMAYDSSEFNVTITVTDDLEGQLHAVVAYDKAGESADNAVFNNTYTAQKVELNFNAYKDLDGQDLRNEHFEFVLKDAEDAEVESKKNNENGAISFSPIEFTEVGTYTYTISEVEGDQGGMTYDSRIFEITVNVTDNREGQLEAEYVMTLQDSEEPLDEIRFLNNYQAAPTTADLKAKKELTGQEFSLDQFEFKLVDLETKEEYFAGNDLEGNVFFETLTYEKTGVYNYEMTEVDTEQGGMTYDPTVYQVVVTVTDDDVGQLHASVAYLLEEDEIAAEEVVFNNRYQAAPTTVQFEATKELDGQALRDDHFEFQLTGVDNDFEQVVTNNAEGQIVFDELEFTEVGIYTYELQELNDELGGVTYDENVYTLVVTVTDDGVGQLHATVAATLTDEIVDPARIVFENSYEAAPDSVIIQAEKNLTGRDLANGEFAFELVDADGKVIQKVTNNANGQVFFEEIQFGTVGEYVFTIREVASDEEGMTYDSQTYKVIVTVTDDGEGGLIATAEYPDGKVVFNNTFENLPLLPLAPEEEDPSGSGEGTLDDTPLPNAGEAQTYTLLALVMIGLGFALRFYQKRFSNENE